MVEITNKVTSTNYLDNLRFKVIIIGNNCNWERSRSHEKHFDYNSYEKLLFDHFNEQLREIILFEIFNQPLFQRPP